MVDARYIVGNIAGLLWVAVRSFLGTVLALSVAGGLLAGAAYYFLSDYPWYGLIAVAVTLVEALAAGILLGSKRAFIMTLAHGLGQLRLGAIVVRVLFERLLGVSANQPFGERGGLVAQHCERVPLTQAEKLLSEAVSGLVNAQPNGAGVTGWIRARIERTLLRLVARYTLARFRDEGAKHGGIDLVKMQAELEAKIDDRLIAKLRSGLNLWLMLVMLGLPLTVCVQTYIAIALLNGR